MTRLVMTIIWTVCLAGCGDKVGDEATQDVWVGDTGQTTVIVTDPVITTRSCDVVVSHVPEFDSSLLEIAGEFSDWKPIAMQGPDSDGSWTVSLGELSPGEYGYKFISGGLWEDSVSGPTHWVGGFENRNLIVADCMQPLLQVDDVNVSGDGSLTARFVVASAADGQSLDGSSVVVTVGGEVVDASVDASGGLIDVTVTDLAAGKHSIRVWASDEAGRPIENEPFYLPLWVEDSSFEWTDGLMYFAFTDRFRNGDYDADKPICSAEDGVATIANRDGGDFLGVIHALKEGYFEDLGVTSLWLSPVNENPSGAYYDRDYINLYASYHGYWPIEPRGVEGCFGDVDAAADERLVQLIDEAHNQGIRVIFDLVLNHVHDQHPWVSEHPEWFHDSGCVCGLDGCDWTAQGLQCWFTDYLPDIDYRQHDAVTAAVDDVIWWMETYDVDGFRVDAAKHMDTVIINNLRARLDTAVTDHGGASIYLVGETFTGGDGHEQIMFYVGDDKLHGQYDFPLMWSIRDTFVYNTSMVNLDGRVQEGLSAYGEATMAPFAGNHDIPRLATELSGGGWGPWANTPDYMAESGGVTQPDMIAKMALIHAFTLTQPGVPLLYYGDEIGLAGDGDPDNRRVMSFDPNLSENQRELLTQVQSIGSSRVGSEALSKGDFVTLWVDDDLYVYARYTSDAVAVVVLNKGGVTRSEQIPIPFAEWDGRVMTTLSGFEQSGKVADQKLPVEMGPGQYGIYSL